MHRPHWFGRRRALEEDLQDEIRSHLAMAAADRIDDGQVPEAARRAALRDFGNVTLTREATRQAWGGRWREQCADVVREIAYAVRLLARAPGFALVVMAVLALGIAANTVVLLLAKGLFLKPLPGVEQSASLDVIVSRSTGGRPGGLSYPSYRYVRDHDRAFTGLAATTMLPFSLGLGTHGERVWGEMVSGNYFEVLGVHPARGRVLLPSDEIAPGQHPVVVIADGLWRRAYGADPNIIGGKILLNAVPLTVVGVTPPRFQGTIVGLAMDLFVPVMMEPQLNPQGPRLFDQDGVRASPFLWGLGRPRPGTRVAAARAETEVLGAQLQADRKIDEAGQRATVLPLRQSPFGAQTYLLPVVVLLGAMGALLLVIVCANVANLVLVRGMTRHGEIAVRLALGASRLRILRLLLVENVVLALPGALAGVLLASTALQKLMTGGPAAAPMRVSYDTSTDGLSIAFSLALACASALVFGFVPALRSSRIDLASTMKDELSPRGTSRGRLRGGLVVAQVAVSLLLLVSAGLVMRSLDAARRADPGFDATNVVSLSVDLQPSGYDETGGRVFYQQVLDALRLEPGIESASVAARLPMSLVDGINLRFGIEHYQPRLDEDLAFLFNVVAPDYFRTLRIGVVAGHPFEQRDDRSAALVAMVNETMARRFWTTPEQALGQRIRVADGEWRTIVGVAKDVKYARINEDPRPHVYLPFLQRYESAMILQVRASQAAPNLLERIRRRIQTIDPNLPILEARLLADQTRVALSIFEIAARWLLIFGFVAAGLSALGIYGLVSFTVKQSTHEIGIRMALGARWTDVVRRFLGRGLRLATIGAAIGLVLSVALSRAMTSVLYGVAATDPVSFSLASAIVLAVAVAASLVPAWRASRIDPITALRHR